MPFHMPNRTVIQANLRQMPPRCGVVSGGGRPSVNADWTPAFAGVTGGSESASLRDAKPGFVGLGFVGPAPSPVIIPV